jgi:transcriptional regulator with XRE-family HTH domain
MPVGQLIKLHRIDRKMSTVYVATHAGISGRYLEMVEAGAKTPSLPTLRRIAKVLRVRTSALVSDVASEDYQGPVAPRLAAAERALYTFRSLSLTDRPAPADPAELAERINTAWAAWFTSQTKFSDVLDVLPGLIVDTEQAVHHSDRATEACRQAYTVYRLARGVLKHAGRADLSPLVSDRAMRYAEETGDPILIAAATWNLSQAMLSNDMPEGGLDLATRGAEQLEPLLPDGTPELFSVYGGLLLAAAIASVRTGDPWRGRDILRGPAAEAARKVGDGNNHHGMVFGPTNVAIHRVSLAAEAGEAGEAIRLADDVDISAVPSLERRTTHLYQLARAHEQRNNDTAVLVHLRMAHRECPQDFQYKPHVRGMVSTLVRRARPSYAAEVREFASAIGLLGE